MDDTKSAVTRALPAATGNPWWGFIRTPIAVDGVGV